MAWPFHHQPGDVSYLPVGSPHIKPFNTSLSIPSLPYSIGLSFMNLGPRFGVPWHATTPHEANHLKLTRFFKTSGHSPSFFQLHPRKAPITDPHPILIRVASHHLGVPTSPGPSARSRTLSPGPRCGSHSLCLGRGRRETEFPEFPESPRPRGAEPNGNGWASFTRDGNPPRASTKQKAKALLISSPSPALSGRGPKPRPRLFLNVSWGLPQFETGPVWRCSLQVE